MGEYAIELDKVSCKAGYQYLLREITWRVRPGEHWVVFGLNGSGKTTLLSIIAGFRHFSSGTVKLWGEGFNNENILAIRQRVGWVSSSFFDKYYTRESALNIVLSGKFGTLGLADEVTLQDVSLAKSLLAELKLADKIDRSFDLLSKGERQNVLIARALMSNPDILILDEPCSGLDVYNRNYLFSTIEALSQSKALTIIYVTHYIEEIIPLFDQALLLKNGHIYAQGPTQDVFCDETMQGLLGYHVKVGQSNGRYALQLETPSHLADLFQ